MARILMACTPMTGHVVAALPVARELATAGHDVLWYGGRRFEPLIRETGAEFTPVPESLEFDEHVGGARGGLADERTGLRVFKQMIIRLIVDPIPGYVRDVAPLVSEFRPDVTVCDHSFLALPIVASRQGVRRVMLTTSPLHVSSADTAPFGTGLPPSSTPVGRLRNRALRLLVTAVVFRDVQRALRRSARAVGMSTGGAFFMDWGLRLVDRCVVTTVPEFEYPRSDLSPLVEFVGPVRSPDAEGWTPPSWWPDVAAARNAGRPVLLIENGSATSRPADLVRPAIDALAGEDVLVVALTGAAAPDDVLARADRPGNLRIERSVPHSELLPLTDAVVTNGGYAIVQAALAHGVPVVATKLGEDEAETIARIRWSGVGVTLGSPGAASIRTAVAGVISEPSYREAAGHLGKAYARYSGTRQAMTVILGAA